MIWDVARSRSEAALASGALQPLPTAMAEAVEDGGIAFSVRVLARAERKDVTRTIDGAPGRAPEDDPFLEPDPRLCVDDVGGAHRLLLNKFPVFADHLLLVTRAFEDQEAPLTRADWDALLAVLPADGLAFYNAGVVAGASQRHKHLQLIRTPVGADLGRATGARPRRFPTEGALDALPFATWTVPLPATGAEAHAVYRDLVSRAGAEGAPHNLLVTTDAITVVPRTREDWHGVSVNALGFAGSILVRAEAELEEVRRVGPIALLSHVARPRG